MSFTIGLATTGSPRPYPIFGSVGPTLSGTEKSGSALTCNPGEWVGQDVLLTYQWYQDNVAIGGGVAAAYMLVVGDQTHKVHCVVTGTNAWGTNTAASAQSATITAP